MTLRFSPDVRTAFAQALADKIAGGLIEVFSGSEPAAVTDPDPSGLLAMGRLPSPALTAANGQTAMASTWAVTGSMNGVAASFRIYDATGVNCRIQGAITATGGGGEITGADLTIAIGQVTVFNGFTAIFGNG